MITLDIDFSYLSRYYNISQSKISKYQGKSITEIMQIEAAQGNERAANFMMKISSNPEQLAQLFQLCNPKNRFLILSHMNEEDLMKVMSKLEPEQIVLGLSIFNPQALVELMKKLPIESLCKIIWETMGPEAFIEKLDEKFLDEFLSSDKLNRDMFTKALAGVDEEHLQKMMENINGQCCYDNKESILQQVGKMKDDQFLKAMMSFEVEGKRQLVGNMIKEQPDLFKEFSTDALVSPFMQMPKEDILSSLMVLDTQELLPMVEELPQEVMALIATQVDPEQFAEILCDDFKDIIAQCGLEM